VLCALLIGFATNWWMMIVARLLVGFGLGGGLSIVNMYINEVSPTEIRGALGTSTQLLITIGIAASQALSTENFHMLATSELWRYMMLFPGACSALLIIGLQCIPETPSFLLKTQGRNSARAALCFFRSNSAKHEIENELDAIEKELALCGGQETVSFREVCGDRTGQLWKPIVIGMFVNLSMQLSGIDAVFFYSTMVFEQANIPSDRAQEWTTLVGVINVLVTIPAMLFMDKLGRKYILATGLGGMCLSFAVITYAMVNGLHTIAVYSMISIIVFFAFGPGCIGWFIVSELSPMHARGFANALGMGVNWFANWLVAFVFPFLLAAMGNWTFIVFIVTTGFLTFFTLTCVPETMGLQPHEVAA
jgi:sugar porter (SP) family MFS transporter